MLLTLHGVGAPSVVSGMGRIASLQQLQSVQGDVTLLHFRMELLCLVHEWSQAKLLWSVL